MDAEVGDRSRLSRQAGPIGAKDTPSEGRKFAVPGQQQGNNREILFFRGFAGDFGHLFRSDISILLAHSLLFRNRECRARNSEFAATGRRQNAARASGGEQTDACPIGIILGNAMARR
jgi:hypothetical protein